MYQFRFTDRLSFQSAVLLGRLNGAKSLLRVPTENGEEKSILLYSKASADTTHNSG